MNDFRSVRILALAGRPKVGFMHYPIDNFANENLRTLENFFSPAMRGITGGKQKPVSSRDWDDFSKLEPRGDDIGHNLKHLDKTGTFSSTGRQASGLVVSNRSEDAHASPVYRLGTQADNSALHKLYNSQEEAAKRIAHRLHDESAQMLASVYLELAEIARDCPDSTVRKIDKVVEHLDEVREQLRALSHELRPLILDQLGLMPALQSLVGGVRKRSELSIVVSGSVPPTLHKGIETALYRVVQEALSNVVRHAKATRVQILLWSEEEHLHCVVSDNGIGFRKSKESSDEVPGLGLLGIHERVAALNGICEIASPPGGGMKLQVSIPTPK